MKKLALILLAAALVCSPLASGDAQAAVALSEHDMSIIAFGNGWGGQGVCSYCHVPHSAAGARLWAASPLASVPVYGASVVAGLCYTCHDGTAATGANHLPSVYNALEVNHVLPDGGAIVNTDQSVTSWPWTTLTNDMECSSCHNPHDNANNQFLRDEPYNDAPTIQVAANDATADTSQFCNNCHQGRAKQASRNGTAATLDGNHPVGSAVVDSRAYGTAGTVDMLKLPYNEVIDNTVTGPDVLGGHLSSYATGGAICNTCHMPHGAAGSFVLATTNSAAGTGYNSLCEDCHTADPSLRFNVARATHPVNAGTGDGNTALGPINIIDWVFTNNLTGSQQGTLGNGEVICLSCHAPHQAEGTTPILREELQNADGSICNDCHGSAPVGGANHPAGDVAEAEITNEDGGVWPNNDGLPLGGSTGTRVVCDTCHAAHDGDPAASYLLRIDSTSSQLCNGCHTQVDNTATDWTGAVTAFVPFVDGGDSANPSSYIENQNYAGNVSGGNLVLHEGTHASSRTIGAVALAAGYDTVLTAASTRATRYPAGVIICQSCHIVHGADAAGGWHGTAGSENILAVENGNTGTRTGTDGGAGAYDATDDAICSACHAGGTNPVAPDGTHPVQAWFVTRTSNAVVNTGAGSYADVQPPTATSDYNGAVMTCESCHAPHAAVTSMGSFILEGGTSDAATGGTRPNVRNRDILCQNCHAL